jgi:hypothetical protein
MTNINETDSDNLTEIQPDKLYWASRNSFEFRIPGAAVIDIARPGPADDAVAFWIDQVREQVEKDSFPNGPDAEAIRRDLAEYGAWDAEELADDGQNWHRLLWIAAGDIADSDEPDFSEPVK